MFSRFVSCLSSQSKVNVRQSVEIIPKNSLQIFKENGWKIIDNIDKMREFRYEKHLIFNKMGDIHSFRLKFENCEYAIFTGCDKNFYILLDECSEITKCERNIFR